jgi:hypothetical protein
MKFPEMSEAWLRKVADAEPGGLMACSPEIWGAMSDEEHWLHIGSRLRDGEPCTHPGCLRHLTHPCEGCGRVGGRSRCEHDRLNEDGICRACGEDRRGI